MMSESSAFQTPAFTYSSFSSKTVLSSSIFFFNPSSLSSFVLISKFLQTLTIAPAKALCRSQMIELFGLCLFAEGAAVEIAVEGQKQEGGRVPVFEK